MKSIGMEGCSVETIEDSDPELVEGSFFTNALSLRQAQRPN
jgi:hypothetical protein